MPKCVQTNRLFITRYPELQNIDFFSPGMKTNIPELATRFNPKAKLENVQRKSFATSQKSKANFWFLCVWLNCWSNSNGFQVCDIVTEKDIIIETSDCDTICKVTCPICPDIYTLSKTNDSNFSVHNFKRHFMTQHQPKTSKNDEVLNSNGGNEGSYFSSNEDGWWMYVNNLMLLFPKFIKVVEILR